MPIPFIDGVFTLGGVDLSDNVQSVTVSIGAAELDASSIASTWDEIVAGRKNYSVNVTFMDDFEPAALNEVIWDAFSLGDSVPWTLRAKSEPVGEANPEFSGELLVTQDSVGGGAGDLLTKQVTWRGTGPMDRSTSGS